MEPLTKKPSGIAGGISFASAAAGGRTTSTPTVGSNGAGTGTGTGMGAGAGTGTGTGGATGTGAGQGARAAGASASSSRGGINPSSGSASPALGSSLSSSAPSVAEGSDKSSAASASTSASPDGLDWILGLSVKATTLNDEVFEGQVYAYDVTMNCVCPSKTQSTSTTPTIPAYYSPLQGGSNGSTNGIPRPKYDFRILKINYLKDITPLKDSSASASGAATAAVDSSESSKGNNGSATASPNLGSPATNTTKGSTGNITAAAPGANPYASVVPAVGYVQLDKFQQREQQAVKEAQLAAARIGVGVSTLGQDIFDALSKTLPCRWAKDSIVVMDEVIIAPPYEPENCKASTPSYALTRVKKVLELERLRITNGRK